MDSLEEVAKLQEEYKFLEAALMLRRMLRNTKGLQITAAFNDAIAYRGFSDWLLSKNGYDEFRQKVKELDGPGS